MSEKVEPTSPGTYDDVPDEDVATVLNVPLRLSATAETVGSAAAANPTQIPPGMGRHRKPESPAEVPAESMTPPQSTAGALRPPRRRTSSAYPPVPSPPTYRESDSDSHWRATLKVGAISAAIVFGGAALALVALTWLP